MGENQENFKAEALEHANIIKDARRKLASEKIPWDDPENEPPEDEISIAEDSLFNMLHSKDPDQLAALKEAVWEVAGTNRDTALDILGYMTGRGQDDYDIDDLAFLGIEKLLAIDKRAYDKWIYNNNGKLVRDNRLTAAFTTIDEVCGVVKITNHGANKAPMFEIFVYHLTKAGTIERTVFHEENLLDTSTDFASQIKARLATMKVEYPEYFPE